MAETQLSTLGNGAEFWLNDGAALYKLREVKRFDVAAQASREQVEKTNFDSPAWTKEYLSSFYEDTDIVVVLNSRIRSDTDLKIAAAQAADAIRAFKQVIPENGVPATQILGTCRVINYERGTVEPGGLMEATMTIRIVTLTAPAPYAA